MNRNTETAIVVENLQKSFRLPNEQHNGLKQLLLNFFRRSSKKTKGYETQHVLDDISFEIKKGEFFGVVGRNGSGKSTLLKLLAGIYSPDSGLIKINGTLTPFIELGVGFNPELTGRENIFLNGALLGFSKEEMEVMYDDIVEFAELEKFMDQKLKNYSSGMQVRLAFSIAIRAKSDILLIDEVLAVGDAAFQTKCFDYFYKLKEKGATVVFISHDKSSLERFCDRGVLIHDGKLIDRGSISKIMKSYSNIVLEELEKNTTQKAGIGSSKAYIDDTANIEKIETLDSSQKSRNKFVYGDSITIRFEVVVKKEIINPILGVTIWQKHVNKPVYATNTLVEDIKQTGTYKAGERVIFSVDIPPLLNDGEFTIEPAIANTLGTVFYDQVPNAAKFIINGSNNPYSVISSHQSIKLEKL